MKYGSLWQRWTRGVSWTWINDRYRESLPADLDVGVMTLDTPETGPLEQTTDLSDYREVDGVKVPFQLKSTNAVQSFTVAVTKIEHNIKIDPALFVKPASK